MGRNAQPVKAAFREQAGFYDIQGVAVSADDPVAVPRHQQEAVNADLGKLGEAARAKSLASRTLRAVR